MTTKDLPPQPRKPNYDRARWCEKHDLPLTIHPTFGISGGCEQCEEDEPPGAADADAGYYRLMRTR